MATTSQMGAKSSRWNEWILRDVTWQKRSSAEQNDLVRRLMQAEEEERPLIARELHLGQEVTGLSLGLNDLETKVLGEDALTRTAWLRELTDKIGRELHRKAIELRPTSLQDLGLGKAILDDECFKRQGTRGSQVCGAI